MHVMVTLLQQGAGGLVTCGPAARGRGKGQPQVTCKQAARVLCSSLQARRAYKLLLCNPNGAPVILVPAPPPLLVITAALTHAAVIWAGH
jgi:hypothetical protein